MNETITSVKATRREWIGLGVLALPCLLYSMDLTVLILAIPHLAADLAPSSTQMLWIVDIYGFLVAGSLITMGTLGDRIGRRKLLMIGATAFGIASIFAAFASSAGMLICARALLGVAAATLSPSTLSLIRNMFLDPQERTVAIGIWVASFSAGGALGPLIGGALLTWFPWGSVFLIAVPVMVLLLVLAPLLLPEYRDPNAGRLDIVSAALSLTAVLAVIYGLKWIAESGPGWQPALIIAAGLAVGLAFVRRQRQLADPLIDMRLFRLPSFSAALAINIVGVFVAFGSFLFFAQYLQLVLDMGPLEAGLWTAPSGVVFIIGSMVTPQIVRRIAPVHVVTASLVITALGFVVLAFAGMTGGLPVLMAGFLIFCFGLSPVFTLTTDLVIGSAPPERAGAASGLSETSAEFGGALGIAVLGSILTAVYRSTMTGSIPAEASSAAAEAARSTLGGALELAARLQPAAGEALAIAAKTAFAQGFVLVSAISAVGALAAALLAASLLRRTGPPATAEAASAGTSAN